MREASLHAIGPREAPATPLERAARALAARLAAKVAEGRWIEPYQHVVAALTGAADDSDADPADVLAGVAPWQSTAHDATGGHAVTPLDRLVAAFGLSPLEVELVVLAGLPDHDLPYAQALRALHPQGEPRPTAWLAGELLCAGRDERRRLATILDAGAAVRARVLRVEPPTAVAPERSLLLADGLWATLRGDDAWPAAMAPQEGPVVSAGLEAWLCEPEVEALVRALAAWEPLTLVVTADSEEVATARASALAERAGVRFARLGSGALVGGALAAHAGARELVPVVQLAADVGDASILASLPGPAILCGRAGMSMPRGGQRRLAALEVGSLRPRERVAMWRRLLPGADEAAAAASRYALEPAIAAQVADDARAAASREHRPVAVADVAASVRARSTTGAIAGATRIHPVAGWDQLVVRPDQRRALREAVDRLLGQAQVLDDWRFLHGRPGARGVRMLLSGPPGTGKTLTAEVLARELGLDLLVVDISRVVSKWIGETEKNLGLLFDAAERANAVLLFDEADALFGKRTEVSDARDRYANLETAYLLSRLERFESLAILTTNYRQNIDPAFARRLEFIVAFDEPALAERSSLWSCHLPAGAPIAGDVDPAELAALFPVTGALIRNAATAAAFLAAAETEPIRRRHVVHAMRREYDKAGRAFPVALALA